MLAGKKMVSYIAGPIFILTFAVVSFVVARQIPRCVGSPTKPAKDEGAGKIAVSKSSARAVFKQANDIYAKGDYLAAEPLYKRLLYRDRHLQQDLLPADEILVCQRLSKIYSALDHFENWIYCLETGLQIAVERFGKTSKEAGLMHFEIGEANHREGKYELAQKHFKESYQILKPELSKSRKDGRALISLAKMKNLSGDSTAALKFYKMAVNAGLECQGRERLIAAEALQDIAGLQLENRPDEFEKGRHEPLYRQAIEISVDVAGKDSPEAGYAWKRLGTYFYQTRSEYAKGEEALGKALRIQESCLYKNSPSLADTLDSLAGSKHFVGKKEEALQLAFRAHDIHEIYSPPGSSHSGDGELAFHLKMCGRLKEAEYYQKRRNFGHYQALPYPPKYKLE